MAERDYPVRDGNGNIIPLDRPYGAFNPLGTFSTGIEMALYGDSRTSGAHTNITAYGATMENAVSPAGWICAMTEGRVIAPYDLNFGVGSDTTTLMLARLNAVCQCRAPLVLLLGSINDRGGAAMTAAQSIENLTTMLDALTLAGKTTLLISELPRGDSTYTSNRISGTQLAYHGQVRSWMNTIVPLKYPNSVVVFDVYDTFAVWNSATGDAILGMHHDGLHPATLGAYTEAQPVIAWINANLPKPAILPTSNSAGYDATNNPYGWLNSNPMLDGTTGTAGSGSTGNVATGYTSARNSALAAGAMVITNAKVSKTNGMWQQVTITGNTAANSAPQYAFYQDVVANIAADDEIEVCGRVEVDASHVGLVGAYISMRYENPTAYEQKALDRRDTNNPLPTISLAMLQRVTKTLVPPGTTVARLRMCVDLAESIVGVSTVVRFGQVGAKKIREI